MDMTTLLLMAMAFVAGAIFGITLMYYSHRLIEKIVDETFEEIKQEERHD